MGTNFEPEGNMTEGNIVESSEDQGSVSSHCYLSLNTEVSPSPVSDDLSEVLEAAKIEASKCGLDRLSQLLDSFKGIGSDISPDHLPAMQMLIPQPEVKIDGHVIGSGPIIVSSHEELSNFHLEPGSVVVVCQAIHVTESGKIPIRSV